MAEFPALPHYYKWQFMYFEPFSTVLTTVLIWGRPGAAWFMHGLGNNSDRAPIAPLNDSAELALWQLANCYLLLGLLSSFGFRAVRNALPGNPVAQERIVGASLLALAIADVTHILVTFLKLTPYDRYSPGRWNSNIHGNITFTIYLFLSRMAWFAGVGRRRYYYGQPNHSKMQ